MSDVDYEKWAVAMMVLLDEIEQALNDKRLKHADLLVRKRFEIAEDHGLEVEFTPVPSDIADLRRDH